MGERNRLHGIYEKALQQTGHQLTGKESYSKLQSMWKDYRQDYKAQYGTTAPTVYEASKNSYAGEDIPTIDFGRDYIINFINRVDTIYRDTLSYIDNNKEGTHASGKLASIASYKTGELAERYIAIKDTIREMVNDYGTDIVAQAIADNVELDYTIAVTLLPPSDVFFEFDETISQLLAITNQLNARAEQLAIEAEENMW